MMPPQHNVPGAPPPQAPHSSMSILAFIFALVGFLIGLIPFAGLLGTLGLVLAIIDLSAQKRETQPRRHGFSIAGLVLGILATLGALVWAIIFAFVSNSASRGSCPHVYSHDGQGYRLDADLASGALYRGAERDDVDRLESVRVVDGQYRVRIQNDLQEVDHVDRLQLLVADTPEDTEVLPTADGALVGVRARVAPSSRERESFSASNGQPRERWRFTFARPEGGGTPVLVLRARNTPFAEDALVRYLATMGQGLEGLLQFRSDEGCACYKQYLDEEIHRLGLPMSLDVRASRAQRPRAWLSPIGPAIHREFAVALRPSDADGPVTVSLEATQRFWDVSSVELATLFEPGVNARELDPVSATLSDGRDARRALSRADGERISLTTGQRADVAFDAGPAPPAGARRTVLARLRGYYDLPIGGSPGVNAYRLAAHRFGWISLPDFARALPANRAE